VFSSLTMEEHVDLQQSIPSKQGTETGASSLYTTVYGTVYGAMSGLIGKKFAAKELTWKNLTVVSKTGQVQLLSDICGSVKGRLLAVMGSSGSGKTTFLNQLSMRGEGVDLQDGNLLIDGQAYSSHDIKNLSGYVLQDDILFDKLTVQEVLMFGAEMRMHPSSTVVDKQRKVNKLLALMDLTECKNVIVGSPLLKGISGGQRKRLCVALELIIRPSILFLDEPTSGLDSVNALALMDTLRHLANKENVTIVTTVHQPSTRMFSLFDDLLILDHGGVMYQGPASMMMDQFASAGFPCPAHMNPAEWALEVIASPDARKTLVGIPDASNTADAQEEELQRMFQEEILLVDEPDTKSLLVNVSPSSKISWWHQFSVLFKRSVKLNLRDKRLIAIQLVQTIIMALLVGGVFFQLLIIKHQSQITELLYSSVLSIKVCLVH
jgi:ATP-binding cassette subfamily G (WHITE) protein 2